ncbi:DUF7344 domain-containing protein [Haladaptatus sp. NG-SE-30]
MRDLNDTPATVVELLDQSRCQDVLCYLRQQERPVSLAELTRKISQWESDHPDSDVPDGRLEDISTALQQDHLPTLIEVGLIERQHSGGEEYFTTTEKVETIESNLQPRPELGPTEYRVE